MIFNDRLILLRKEHDSTQDKTARDLDMPTRSYQRLEANGAKTHYDTLIKIADHYDVSVDWLMGRTDIREVDHWQQSAAVIFNERLILLRTERKLTQDSTARELDMPMGSYQRLEADGAKGNYDTLIKIADHYGVSVDWLMGRTDVREINR